jgi:Methyltransferase FkbM domain
LKQFEDYTYSDDQRHVREGGVIYELDNVSLVDLLDKYEAPRTIDYLSIDTEVSEFEILKAFDFGKYKFRVITCEHNFTSARTRIVAVLQANGYRRKLSPISRFDDWYVPV